MWYKISNGFIWILNEESRVLPSAYQEVEYIQNSGTQYIDTWFYPDSNTMVQMKYVYTNYNWWIIFWNWLWEPDQFRYFVASWPTTYLDYWSWNWYNRIQWSYITSTSQIYETEFWNRYVKDIPTNTIKFSSSAVSFSRKSYTARIFIEDWSDLMKLYYCKVYDNWTLVRDFVPCYRKSDNVVWLYDLVNDQFYTNAWSWTFTKGNDVAPTYVFKEKQFYPGGWEPSVDWILFDETDYKNSVPSKNGKFHYVWWGNVSYWTNIWYDTTNWRVYSTSSHSLWATNINANSELVNAKKIKFICDYLYCYNYNTYLSWTNFFPFTMQMNYNFSASLWDQTTSDPAIGSVVAHSTPYSAEFYYDLDLDSWTLLIKNLNTQAETELAIAWFKYTWDTNLSWWNLGFSIWMDQGRSSYMWDVHLYYSLT